MQVIRTNSICEAWLLPEGWSNDIPEWATREKLNGRLVWNDIKKFWSLNGSNLVARPGDYIIKEKSYESRTDNLKFCKSHLFDKFFTAYSCDDAIDSGYVPVEYNYYKELIYKATKYEHIHKIISERMDNRLKGANND